MLSKVPAMALKAVVVTTESLAFQGGDEIEKFINFFV
jgi:hypothetical protein